MREILNKKGSSMILFSVAMVLIMGLTALVIDVGNVALQKQKFQNAIDAATLAAAQELPDRAGAIRVAKQYVELNGFDESDISIDFSNDDSTISITANKKIDFFFARIFGFDSMTTSINSSASMQSMGVAFNYVLFSGSRNDTLNLNGSNFYIKGSTHSNRDFNANGSRLTITGACEAVTTIRINGSNINVNTQIPNASYVEMPDFSETIRLRAEQSGNSYHGNKVYNSSYLNVDSPIYINGNVTINGSHFSGKGCILATGDITFNGSNLNQSSNDAVCFYSQNGDITINGSNAKIEGIIYAPNGTVTFNGSNQTINGRVIANKIRFNGSSVSIIGGTTELKSLPSHGVKLVR